MSRVISIPLDTPIRDAHAVMHALYVQAKGLDPNVQPLGGNRFLVSDEAADVLLSGAPITAPAPRPRKAAAKRKAAPAKAAAKRTTKSTAKAAIKKAPAKSTTKSTSRKG